MVELHEGCRTLVVDDDPVIRSLVRAVCLDLGMDVTEAQDGAEALRCAHQAPFDVILLDVNMPVMDGLTFARELRAAGFLTPIVVLTAHDASRRAREIGAEAFLDKPFDIDELGELLMTVCHRSAAVFEATPSYATDATPGGC